MTPGGRKRAVLLLVWLASAAYVYPGRLRGWIPHDEGVLAQEAEYVATGALPHRDFMEVYTGGLSYWNALALRLFGVRMSSPRLLFFLSFLAFVPAVFAIASRFGSPLAAGLATLLAVVWSVPNYFCGSAAWYNAFFAVGGMLALINHIETRRRRWLFAAGFLAGMSVLFKVAGLFFVAASLLFLLYREQQISAPGKDGPAPRWRLTGFFFFKTAGLSLYLAALFYVIRYRIEETEFVYLMLPSITACGFLIWCEATRGGGSFARRIAALAGLILPMAGGILLAVGVLLVPFALRGGLGDLGRGLFAGTGAHLLYGSYMPPLSKMWHVLPYAVVLGAGSLRRSRFLPLLVAAAAVAAAWVLWRSGDSVEVYRGAWSSAFFLAPFVVFVAFLRLSDAHRLGFWSPERRQEIFLLAVSVAMASMVLFPLSTSFYFFYIAPAVILAVFGLAASERRPPRIVHAVAFAFYFLFALLRTNPSYIYTTGHHFEKHDFPVVLEIPRGGRLRVREQDAHYNVLVPFLLSKSGGKAIYAGPDAQEVHFLSGLPDAAPHDAASPLDPLSSPDDLFRAFERDGTRVAVLNRTPPRRKMRPAVVARFESFFPSALDIGPFTVRWRE